MRRNCLKVLAGAFVLLHGFVPANADMLVWSENAVVKVRPNDPPKPRPPAVKIFAARNEYEPFQIIIRASGHRLRGVDVELTDFFAGRGNRIPCRENCTIYRELYITITNPSGPYGSVGEWPDALIPKIDRYAGERRNAFPFDVAENRNQPVWIDVYVPPSTAPGLYIAYASVRANGEPTVRIPVYLTVWGFTLPATSSLKNAFLLWGLALPGQHGASFTGETLDELVKTYSKALLAHRLSNGWLIGGGDWQPTALNLQGADRLEKLQRDWGPFFDGSVLPNGSQMTAIVPIYNMCLGGPLCEPEVLDSLSSAGWLNRMSFYLPDEPNLADQTVVDQIRSIADSIHQRDGRLRTLLTHSYSEILELQVDIWVAPLPVLEYSIESDDYWRTYAAEIARGKQVWVYQACFTHSTSCGWVRSNSEFPDWPDYMIDMQGMKNRIQDWINWKFRVHGELYWGVNYQFYPFDPFPYDASQGQLFGDPYLSQFAWGGNGEGNLFYPGTPSRIGGTTHIPIESIRLKLKREGLEDYEYLVLLTERGAEAFADSKVAELVQSARRWEHDPTALYRVRNDLAAQLEVLSRLTDEGRTDSRDGTREFFTRK